ncbi:hypothetical protein pb186bvf_012830 [Paramecium bursaria]
MKQPKRNSQSRLTSQLEQETNQMEERIVGLKQMLQTMKTKDRNIQSSGGTRWQQATTQKPLKSRLHQSILDYAKQTLEQQKRIFPIKKQQNQRNTSAQKIQPSSTKSVEGSMDKSLTNFLSLSGVQQTKAASNLNRALILQKEQQNDVVQFLVQNQLSQYASTFIDNGFDDFEILKEIQIQHLDDMKIPPQDGKKIINLLKAPQIVEKQVEKKVEKSVQNQKIQTPKSVEVEYNEEESHKYFLEALLDFRNQNPKEEIQIQLKKNEFYGPISSKRQKQQKQRMSFLLQGESTWHQQEDFEQVQQTEEPKQVVKNKGSCYSCYKLIDTDYGFKVENKAFCGKNCLLTYNSSQIYLCKSQSCQKQLNKEVAYYEVGRFFCTQECYNQFIWEQKNTDIKNISL